MSLFQELDGARWRHEEVERDMDREFEKAGEGVELQGAARFGGLSAYIGPHTLLHEDFNISSKEYTLVRQYDFCWKVHGVSLMEQYYPDLSSLLDREFDYAFEMTSNTLNGRQGVDTQPFRQSVWYYVLRVMGLCHDDFDYHLVNRLLNIKVKQYVKKLSCSPNMITSNDYDDMGYKFQPDEQVHVNILAIQARRQAELIHALHAVAQFMK
mmetsp:Transcript_55846/g.131826  ORF Transcript_55846/g.131826 Transcript_55846/m.131826 type:complete len:211 (-) Transcript_55846:24-656(-)